MSKYKLQAVTRELTGKKIAKLREKDQVPGVLYGPDTENQNISIKKNEFIKTYNQAGSSHLIDIVIDDKKELSVLVQDTHKDPLSGEIIHFDLYQVQEGKKMTAVKELEFIGEAPAVKELGGILIKNFDEIEIECLPKDLELVDKITVDLSVLKSYSDIIHISDLHVPKEIKIMEAQDDVVAAVTEQREEKEEEVKPVEAEADKEAEAAKEGEEASAGEEKK